MDSTPRIPSLLRLRSRQCTRTDSDTWIIHLLGSSRYLGPCYGIHQPDLRSEDIVRSGNIMGSLSYVHWTFSNKPNLRSRKKEAT